jgi:hypothetical protein
MNMLKEVPCWLWYIAVLLSLYQGIRGAVEQSLNPTIQGWNTWQKWFVLYSHEFIFRFICSMAGFVSLYVAYFVVNYEGITNLSASTSALTGFLFLVGFIGVGGQLHYAVLFGKLPR